jgi:hypothetical protein
MKTNHMFTKTTFIPGIGIIVVLITLWIVISAQRPISRADDEKTIRAHIDKIVHAYMDRDSVTVRQTHSKNWRGFLSGSQKILRGIDDYMKEAAGSGIFDKSMSWKIVNYKMLDYDIVFHENTGVVNYVSEMFWEDGQNKGSYKLRSIDIYAKENGHWNQVASNIGPLPEKQ